MPIDILYIIPRPEIGGAERQLLMLMQGLDRDRYRPHVICLDGGGSLLDDYRRASETCVVLNRRGMDMGTLRTLIAHIKRINPAIVHTWLYIANLYGGVAARLARVPYVIASQRGLGIDPQHGWFKIRQITCFNRLIARLSDRLIANARAVADLMYRVGFCPERTRIICNGLDLDIRISDLQKHTLRQELDIRDDQIILCAIARIDPKKDLATMLRAFALVTNNHPNARLFIAGGGFPHYQSELETLADELRIRQSVDFLGFRDDPQAILSLCDISLLSSLTEGLPNAILESMALGKPVVATSVGGVPELIDHGIQGLLSPVGDHRQFARHICDIIEHPDRACAMGLAGKEKARQSFSRRAMVQKTEDVYAELLDRGGKGNDGQWTMDDGKDRAINGKTERKGARTQVK